jgi:hypothetical protein
MTGWLVRSFYPRPPDGGEKAGHPRSVRPQGEPVRVNPSPILLAILKYPVRSV